MKITSMLARAGLCGSVALTLAGCMASTPAYDAHFGDAVRTVRAMQTLNPNASMNTDPVTGVAVGPTHGRLRISESRPVHAAWAANIWWDAERIAVSSIGHAARQLRGRQRNWASYAPEHRGRAQLITEKLPHVAARPLELGEVEGVDGRCTGPGVELGLDPRHPDAGEGYPLPPARDGVGIVVGHLSPSLV